MADLNTRTFFQLVQGQAAAIQARAAGLVDFAVGSILRAITESTAAVVLWLQGLILQVLAMTRLGTSTGADADSFVADFGGAIVDGGVATFERLDAERATGVALFSRLTATGSATVPVGATIETADGSQDFAVVIDTTNPAWDGGLAGYVMAPGETTVSVPVVAVTAGSGGNVLSGTVTVITSAIPGVDQVTNPLSFAGGVDEETDAQMRVRFREYIISLREATPAAIIANAKKVQAGLSLTLVENKTLAGEVKRGFIFLVVDDGSGAPPESLLQAVRENVDLHRAAGVEFAVYAPTILSVSVSAQVILKEGMTTIQENAAMTAATNAVRSFLNSQPVGADVSYTQVYQVIYNASPNIQGVTNLLLNGGTANIVTALNGVIKAGTVVLS